MTNSYTVYGAKIIGEFFTSLLFFPLWWYTKGLVKLVKGLIDFLREREKGLAFFVWLKNIFTPMYGESDWQGKIISFLVRVVQIFFRGLAVFLYLVIVLVTLVFWLTLPGFVAYGIMFQIF